MTSLSRKKLLAACAAGALLAAGSAQAQDATWTNGDPGDNLWSTADNWDTSAVPGSGDQAEINLSGADRAIVDTGDPNLPAAFGHLRIGQGSGTSGELEVISGTLNADDTLQDRIGVGGGTAVVNQSGGTVRLGGAQVQLGLDGGSSGTYNLTGGTFIGARESSGTTLFVGQSGGNGTFNVSGGEVLTRAGVELGNNGGTGLFNVQGSAATGINIGGEGSLAGRWIQNDGSTVQFGIDSGGVTPISILADDGSGGDVTFESGSLLDPGFVDESAFGTWTVMQWDGTLTDNGLAFAPGVDESIWSFAFEGNELQLTAVPEPSTYALLFGGAGGLLVLLRRRKTARRAS